MPPRTVIFNISIGILSIIFFYSCRNAGDTRFPQEADEYVAPVTSPIQFGEAQKIIWTDTPANLKTIPAEFNLDRLPVSRFDSTGFNPFTTAPEKISFDWSKLPEAAFNYDSLPEIPLQFKTFVLAPPEISRVVRPILKTVNSEIVYDFGDQLNGIDIGPLLKANDGTTWITTHDGKGIYRYDGENLFRYTINELSAGISGIKEDKSGQLWLTTFGNGVFVLDLKNGISRHLSKKVGFPADLVVDVMIDHQNRVWIAVFPDNFNFNISNSGGVVAIIDQQKKKIKLLQHAHGLSNETPTAIMQATDDNIWVPTADGGINIIDLKDNKIRYMDKAHGLDMDTTITMKQDSRKRIWTSSWFGKIRIIDIERGTIQTLGEKQGFGRSFTRRIVEDPAGNMWIAHFAGVRVVDPDVEKIKVLNEKTGLNGKGNDATLLLDGMNQILIGSVSGINIIGKSGYNIRRIGNTTISTMLAAPDGRIWIGALDKGIHILDTATGMVRLYDHTHGLSDDQIQNIAEYNGRIVLSTQKGGIEITDSLFKKIERIGTAQGLATPNVTAIVKDKNNNLWLGGFNSAGVDVLDLKNKKLRHIGPAQGLPDSTIIDIKRDKKDLMWAYSQNKGISVIDLDNKTIRHITKSNYKSLTGAIEDNFMMTDDEGRIFLGSSVNGIFIINAARDSVTNITVAQGLLSNAITYLKVYKGRIYAGTNGGINILTPPSLSGNNRWKIESLGKKEGITKKVRTYNSDLLLQNGQYWWGDEGITIVSDLDQHINDTLSPATYITGLDVYGLRQNFVNNPWENLNEKDTVWGGGKKSSGYYVNGKSTEQLSSLNADKLRWDSLSSEYNMPVNLRLPYNKNYLQFHFAQMHLGTQDTVWYRYILEGIDQKWSEKTYKESSDNYPNISPGYYTFKVASLYKGKWSTPVAYSLTITPPWYKTWWAWLIYLFMGAGILSAYIAYRSRRLKEENKILEEKVALRTKQLEQSIEDLKATQTQLVQSEKMASLGELTAGIAHEIQNPLNFVNNFSEVSVELANELKEELNKIEIPSDQKINLEDIVDDIVQNQEKINFHGKRADSIVKGMLQHSRNTSGHKEPTDINALADEYLRLSYHGLRAKDKLFNATMKTDFDKSLQPVSVVPQDIGRAVLNLFTNAFYSVSEKKTLNISGYEPTVTVSTKKLAHKVEIRVKDNGMGVPRKVLDKIFQPFFTTKPSGQGTGLGLSLTYDIITKAHGGELKVDTKEGEGAEFIILLPL
jgi:signal transduction histidine kinase/ligand-binding sensor domain-containing protein